MAFRLSIPLSAAAFLFLCPAIAKGDTLTITSNPPGATVEINGVTVGTTPYEEEVPGGYFHKTKTALGHRLEHPMVARLSLSGYDTKEIDLTDGPMYWVSLKGQVRGEYFLIKAKHFHVDLDPVTNVFTGTVSIDIPQTIAIPIDPQPELSVEDVVARAKGAVVRLKAAGGSGSGFFITETGVIATNAHVARGEQSLIATLSSGRQLDAKVIYIDRDRDIALAKVDGSNFPHLTLAAAASVRQGETVVVIGNPGGGILFSASKGIVSAIGKVPRFGPGLWIQTDATINPGNSGGPLLNSRGQVIGINTLKIARQDVSGIGFALSASDLLVVLRKCYPDLAEDPTEQLSTPAPNGASSSARSGQGTLVFSQPVGAEVWVQNRFFGNIPGTVPLPVGTYLIIVKAPGRADWIRSVTVVDGMHMTLDPWPE